ncbi:hypothetical protein A225_R1p0605 (plasmid) [Klebsiella michiganensis E718]|uniref:Uncharacterized protein n=1 Tax=Raoultella ornithinolytica TaxID=54291 RepID=A0A1V0M3V9_RAOOR|nr:hypothetical protein A225_R1p0605 [Klebsiella michiganensis E718]ARD69406.1 Hypothetical protein [Raoultella ornithinolytica]
MATKYETRYGEFLISQPDNINCWWTCRVIDRFQYFSDKHIHFGCDIDKL